MPSLQEIFVPQRSEETRRALALRWARTRATHKYFDEQTTSKETVLRERALFQVRFQPPSIAHLSTVKAILKEWKHLTIGIVYNSPRPDNLHPDLQNYLDKADITSYGPGKNPFTREEVKEMWMRCLRAEGLSDRVTCVFIKRQEFEPDFETAYHPDNIDLVLPEPGPEDTQTDQLRHEVHPTVYKRKIFYVKPLIRIHNSKIREIISSGAGDWSQFIPEGAHEAFLEMNGPARIEEANALIRQSHEAQ